MNLGAENAKKTYLAIGLFVVALIMVVRFISSETGGSTPAAATATNTAAPPPTRPARRTGRIGSHAKNEKTSVPVTPQLDPRLNLVALKGTEDMQYDGAGRNIFTATEEPKIPQPIAPPIKPGPTVVNNTPPSPAPRPAPPPINLKFFGFASGPDHKHVFLATGEDVMVASEGDIVQRRYKIVKINDKSIEVLDVLSNNKQTIPLTAG